MTDLWRGVVWGLIVLSIIWMLTCVGRAQEQDDQPRVLVIVIPDDLLTTQQPPPVVPVKDDKSESDLMLATVAYVGGVAASWASAGATCVGSSCPTFTPTMPTVAEPKVAIPFGLIIQGMTLYAVHQWIGPRWPKVAQGLLYSMGTVHTLKAADHVRTSRRQAKGLPP